MSWQTAKIEEIASVKGGKRLPKGHDFVSDPSEHLYIRARDIGNNRITLTDAVYLMDDTFSKIKSYTVSTNDVVVTIVGANIGDVGFITNEYDGANLTENAARIRVNEKVCDPRFLSFQISTPRAKEKFQLLTGGSAQGKLGLYKINTFDVVLPPIAAQKRIASILSFYDDLIENNRRRVQLLEQAARLLYKEWFVHLRFPGHEHTKIFDGVPEGWEKKPLGTIAPLKYGKALKNDDRVPGSFPVYGSSGIVGTHSKPLVHGPTIIVGRKGNVGSVYWSPDDCHPIDTVYYIDSEHCSFFLYYALQQMTFISTDVAVPGLNRDFAHSRSMLVAEQKILRLFEETVTPLHQQMELLKRLNASLAKARDILLPKFMNGEVTV